MQIVNTVCIVLRDRQNKHARARACDILPYTHAINPRGRRVVDVDNVLVTNTQYNFGAALLGVKYIHVT